MLRLNNYWRKRFFKAWLPRRRKKRNKKKKREEGENYFFIKPLRFTYTQSFLVISLGAIPELPKTSSRESSQPLNDTVIPPNAFLTMYRFTSFSKKYPLPPLFSRGRIE